MKAAGLDAGIRARLLLRLYRADFRNEMGGVLVETYRYRASYAIQRSGGALSPMLLWLTALRDSLLNGLGERLRPRSRGAGATGVVTWKSLAAAAQAFVSDRRFRHPDCEFRYVRTGSIGVSKALSVIADYTAVAGGSSEHRTQPDAVSASPKSETTSYSQEEGHEKRCS